MFALVRSCPIPLHSHEWNDQSSCFQGVTEHSIQMVWWSSSAIDYYNTVFLVFVHLRSSILMKWLPFIYVQNSMKYNECISGVLQKIYCFFSVEHLICMKNACLSPPWFLVPCSYHHLSAHARTWWSGLEQVSLLCFVGRPSRHSLHGYSEGRDTF